MGASASPKVLPRGAATPLDVMAEGVIRLRNLTVALTFVLHSSALHASCCNLVFITRAARRSLHRNACILADEHSQLVCSHAASEAWPGVPSQLSKIPPIVISNSVPLSFFEGSCFSLSKLDNQAVNTRSEGIVWEPKGLGSRLGARSTDRVLGAQHMSLL